MGQRDLYLRVHSCTINFVISRVSDCATSKDHAGPITKRRRYAHGSQEEGRQEGSQEGRQEGHQEEEVATSLSVKNLRRGSPELRRSRFIYLAVALTIGCSVAS